MENKINIAELLKNCPKGMELDCIMFSSPVLFYGIAQISGDSYPIMLTTVNGDIETFTKYGQVHNIDDAKCVIFPKGKTTWEGFVPPCQFKDGDIVALGSKDCAQLFIFKEYIHHDYAKCYMMLDKDGTIDLECNDYHVSRLATEEEKEKLFDAIKEHGYKWNAETKTLEKLIEPKFKIGDKVLWNYNTEIPRVISKMELTSTRGYVYWIDCEGCSSGWWSENELTPIPNKFDITTLVPFESEVLVRNVGAWKPAFWGYYSKEYVHPFVVAGGNTFAQCIPYKGNEHLLGTANDCDKYYKTWE